MIEKIEVTEKGIEMLKRVDAWYAERIIIPKEIIIEAYNKFIKEANHVDKNSEQAKDH